MRIKETPISGKPVREKEEGANHVARIEGHLARVFRRNGFEGVVNRTPLVNLLRKEEGKEEGDRDDEQDDDFESREMRLAILQRLVRYLFADGPHPGKVMRRTYAVARAYYPQLICEMNGSDLAIIFDETRATVSARCTLMFSDFVKEKSGAKGTKVSFQKSAQSSGKYARAAKGNQNRKGKKVARLAKDQRRKAKENVTAAAQ